MKKYLVWFVVSLLAFSCATPPPVLEGPLFTGDGGKDIRLAVLAPEGIDIEPFNAWLSPYLQGMLISNFNKFSAMTLLDRQNIDAVLAEQNL
ncbi:hypothetical protein FACS1894200_08450 [Spirochaetia bacterium]|nr:hypothetical protein FACS1894200_08450 [Spirochaetia bacterium]